MRLYFITLEEAITTMFQVDLSTFAANLFVVGLFDPAQTDFVSAYETKHVRRQSIIRVITLRLFVRINAGELQRVELPSAFHLQTPDEPNEFLL